MSTDSKTEDVAIELPLRRVARPFHWLSMFIGLLFVGVAVIVLIENGILFLPIAIVIVWAGLLMFMLGKFRQGRLNLAQPDSCLVNCVSICLDHINIDISPRDLADRLRLNLDQRGTRIDQLLMVLSASGIECQSFSCFDRLSLREKFHALNVPFIALIEQPILLQHWLWSWVLNPIQRTGELISRRERNPPDVKHAVLLYGVRKRNVLIYDPGSATIHSVRFTWLLQQLHPVSFKMDSLLAITNKPDEFESLRIDVGGWTIDTSSFADDHGYSDHSAP